MHTAIAPGTGAIDGDAACIEQIIWILLSNAIKCTPRDGHSPVALTEVSAFVQLSASDTGVGLDLEFLPHVFEQFRRRCTSTTRFHTGVGLGLAITRYLAELQWRFRRGAQRRTESRRHVHRRLSSRCLIGHVAHPLLQMSV